MRKPLRTIGTFSFIFFVLCAAYWPALSHQYVHHDDINFFLRTPSPYTIPAFDTNFFIGRPLGAMRLMAYNLFINQVSDLTFFRFISVLLLSLSAWLMSLSLRNYYTKEAYALLATLAIFTLPPFQILVGFTGICATPVALFLSTLASRFTEKPFLSLILLLMSLLIYPPLAAFYWVIVAVEILSFHITPRDHACARLRNLFLINFSALSVYFLILLVTKPYFIHLAPLGYNPYVMNFSVLKELYWFMGEPLFNALSLWNIFPRREWSYAVLLFLLITCLMRLLKLYSELKKDKMQPKQFYGRCVLFVLFMLLFFFSYLPTTTSGFYRCLPALMSMVMLVILWSLNTWLGLLSAKSQKVVLPVLLAAILAAGIAWANWNLYVYRVKPSAVELQYLLENFKRIDISRLKSVHIIRPDSQGLKFRYDEFGTPTTLYGHNILAVVTCALREINKERLVIEDIKHDRGRNLFIYRFQSKADPAQTFEYPIRISESLKNGPVPGADITIDINRLYEPGGPLDYLRL